MTHIMLIDDSPTVLKILEVAFTREAFTVASFGDGVVALRALSYRTTPIPDVIIIDIMLPKLDGFAVIERVKARRELSQTGIIILSRRDSVIDRLKGRLAGAYTCLGKPFRTAEVIQTVWSFLATRQVTP